MQRSILLALIGALLSGVAVGIQASLVSAAEKTAGAILAGLLVNFMGGVAAGLLLIAFYIRYGSGSFSVIHAPTLGLIVVSGIFGVGIIAGIAYSLPRVGIAAGLSTIIAGQMAVAIIVDTFGLTGGQPIPLNWMRIGGLALLALGTWAILPKE
jgi:transporter family-2 protein